ncbi:MAG: hypothetical protein AB9891_01035 [Anaerolineaceae bacterium]
MRFAFICYNEFLLEKSIGEIEKVFFHLHHYFIHVASIDRLLEKIFTSETKVFAELSYLGLKLRPFKLKSIRRARNHLEHFEERLEAWNYLYPSSPIFDMNIATAQTKGLKEDQCLRLLRVDENLFFILGEKFDLGIMHGELCQLQNLLGEWHSKKSQQINSPIISISLALLTFRAQ